MLDDFSIRIYGRNWQRKKQERNDLTVDRNNVTLPKKYIQKERSSTV